MISCSGETDDSSPNMSDGYIDHIIQQSSKKSTDRGLDSSGDFLDDSEDVFEEEERRKEACDNIVIKFLELTGDKGNSSNLSPAMCVSRHESRGATPVLNLKSNFLKCDQVGISRSTYDEDSLHIEQELRSLENKVSLYERRIDSLEDQLVVAKGAAEEKDLKCDQMWRDLKALEVDLHSSNTSEDVGDKAESSQIEMVVKGLENKLNLYESKIEALEDRLKIVKALAEDKDLQCEELRREVNVLVSRPEQNFHQVDVKDSSQVEHVVKGLENKISLYENKIDSLEDQLKISKVSIEDKDKTCEDLKRELRVTEAERFNLEAKTKDMEVEVHGKKTKIDDLDEEFRTLKAKYSQLELELNEESNKVEYLENKRKDSDLLITGFEIEVNSLKSKLEMCDDENNKLKDDLKIKSGVVDKKSSEIEESNRRMEVLESDINKFETAYQDANMRLMKSDQENLESHVKIRDFETKVKELEREIQAFNKQSSKIEEKMKEMEKDQFKNKRAMFEKPAEEIDLSCKKCENLEKKLKTVQSKFEMAEEQLKALLEKRDVMNEVNNELKYEIDMSLNKNETLIAEYKAKEVDIIGKETEIFGLKNKMIALENGVQKLETNLKTTNGKLDALTVNGEDSDRNLNVAKVNMAKMEEAMEALKDENDKLKQANALLEEDFKLHTGLVQATDSTLSKCEAALEATKKDFDTNCQELKIALDELNSIKASKQEIYAKYDKLVEEHEKIRIKLSEVESKSEECERIVVKLEKENEKLFTDWTAEKAKNQTVVQGLEDEVSQLMML